MSDGGTSVIENRTGLRLQIRNADQRLVITHGVDGFTDDIITVEADEKVKKADLAQLWDDSGNDLQIEEEAKCINLEMQGPTGQTYSYFNIPIDKNGTFPFAPHTKKRRDDGQKSKVVDKGPHLIVRVTSKGTQRCITFSSQAIIVNNTERPVTAYFEFEVKPTAGSKKEEVAGPAPGKHETLPPFSQFHVPLDWYVKPILVNFWIVRKKPGSDREDHEKMEKDMVYENITRLFSGRAKEERAVKAESKIIELQEDFYLSVDILGFISRDLAKPEECPLWFTVQLNPPLLVQNRTMMPLEIWEIDEPRTSRPIFKKQAEIPPGLADVVYHFNTTESNVSDFEFKFFDYGRDINRQVCTVSKVYSSIHHFVPDDLKKKKKDELKGGAKELVEQFQMRLQDQIDTMSELVPLSIRCTKRASQGFDPREGSSGLLSSDLIIEKTRSMSVTLYARCILVNKTNCSLLFGS